jgi:hypothetical protein
MKKLCSIAVSSICFISFINGVTIKEAKARDIDADYFKDLTSKADKCWNFSNPILGISGKTQLRFSNIGGNHYLCSGVSTVTDPLFMQFPVYGNAEFLEGEIYVTLSLAGVRNGVIGMDMQKARLDPATLNGTFEYIGVYADAVEISDGTLTRVPCDTQ